MWLINQEGTKQSLKDAISKVIYIPSDEEHQEILTKMTELSELLDQTNTDREIFYKYYKVRSNGEMTLEQLNDAIDKLKKKV